MIARNTVNLAGHLDGQKVISVSAGQDGSLVVLSIDAETGIFQEATESPHYKGCWHFTNGLKGTYDANVLVMDEGNSRTFRLKGLSCWCPCVDVLPHGEVLVVNMRCDDRNERDNAFVHGNDGRLLRSFSLGDGLEHVQILSNGQIWVGYFDEGVFGNTGWKNKPWVSEAAHSGLACFDSNGNLLWKYSRPPDGEYISDCAALNATDDGIWACTYTNYPLTKVQPDGTIRYWPNAFAGVQSMAVAGPKLLLWDGGSLPEDEIRCTIKQIAGDELLDLGEMVLELPDNTPLDGRKAIIRGRGSRLHAFIGADWHRFELLSAASPDFPHPR